MDALDALGHGARESGLADSLQHLVVRDCASLVELAVEVVEVDDGARVDHHLVPVGARGNHSHLVSVFEDVLEVPWELEHVGMFVLVKREVSAHSLV